MTDQPTIRLWMTQGLPGSGKTALAEKLQRELGEMHCKVISCDSHFMRNGVYTFKVSKLTEYQARANMELAIAMQRAVYNYPHFARDYTIIVDACNILEMPLLVHFWLYKRLEQEYPSIPFQFDLVEPETEWRYDPVECHKRSTQGSYSLEDVNRLSSTFTYNRNKNSYARYRKPNHGPKTAK